MKNRPKTILLMTSTIKPFAGMPHNARSDPAVRLLDYKIALTSYLSLPKGLPDEILFVDNSGHPLEELERLKDALPTKNRNLRFLSITPGLPDCKSKPYGELDIQDQAYQYLLAHEEPNSVVWKVTGRLFVPNIQPLMNTFPDRVGLYCDLRKVPLIGNRFGGNPWFDMRVWAHTPKFYADHLLNLKDKIPLIDEASFFWHVSSLLQNQEAVAPRFKIQPQFSGHCAANNSDYSSETVMLKSKLRRFTRKWTPFVWI